MPPPLVEAAVASSKVNVRAWRALSCATPLVIESIKVLRCFFCDYCFSHAATAQELPQDVRDVTDPLKKRPNPRARKRMASC
jgi:hypothetical protein